MPHEHDDGSQNPSDSQPKFVTSDEIGNIVNSAVTAHLRRFTEKQLPEVLAGALKPITEKLNAPPPPPPEDDGRKKSKQQDPELLAMAKKVEDMEKALASEKERVAAAERKAREERAYSELRGSLEGKVRPELLDMVAKHLFVVEGRVETDETGTALFRSTRVPYTGADPEDVRLPLRAGIEDFLKSDSAKPFLPAPASAGAPQLPKRGPSPAPGGVDFSKPATTDEDKARRSMERERIALEKLNKR